MATRFEANPAAIRQILNSSRMRDAVEEAAERVKDACNGESSWGGYESGMEETNRKRAAANVWTIDTRAAREEARHNRMLRNIGRGHV